MHEAGRFTGRFRDGWEAHAYGRRWCLLFALQAVVAVAGGCTDAGTGLDGDRVAVRIRLSETELVLNDGATHRIHAAFVDQAGEVFTAAALPITWSSTDPGIAAVDDGVVSANRRGEARIIATSGELSAQLDVVVLPVATELALIGGDGQITAVAGRLPDSVKVRVLDRHGDGVGGVLVGFGVTAGGGSIAPGTVATDEDGHAAAVWTLGPGAGEQTATAQASGLAGSPLAFHATAVTDTFATLTAADGDGQSAEVGATLAGPLVVRAMDAHGNPMAGVLVAWDVATGGGSLTPLEASTDSAGLARATWSLGTEAGAQSVTAEAAGLLVSFEATALPGPVVSLEKVSGDAQIGSVGEPLPEPLVVRALDAYGNAAIGATVRWTVTGGGGSIDSVSIADAAGEARATWRLGPTAGAQTAQAEAEGAGAVFSATGEPGPAAVVTVSPDTAVLEIGESVRLSVTAEDAYGNALTDGTVLWSSSDATLVSVDASGLVRAHNAGTVTVAARIDGAEGAAVIQVWTDPLLVAGGSHTCALDGLRSLYCWGENGTGQLGDGSGNDSDEPVEVGGYTFARLSAGANHTCGLTPRGTAYCWGENLVGQLGDGTTTARGTPVEVSGYTFVDIAVGGSHTCALTAAGAAYCWGANYYGQLGDGTTTSRSRPVQVAGPAFTAISAGSGHTCALTASGTAYCWGDNWDGQLGNGESGQGDADYQSEYPVAVVGDESFAAIGLGDQHTCGLTTSGLAYCWGGDWNGQLGSDVTSSYSSEPRVAADGRTFARISVGGQHTCAVTTGGAAYCWGANYAGQLGNGNGGGTSGTAVAVAGPTFVEIVAGGSHTCALGPDGAAYCWGADDSGQLGDGAATGGSDVPVPVAASFEH